MSGAGNSPTRRSGTLEAVTSSSEALRAPVHVVASVEDDRALVRALSQGDERQAAAFYARFRPTVSRTLFRLLRDSQDHEELVQKSMVEAMLSIDRYRGTSSLEAWVAGIASHVALKHLRRQRLEGRWRETATNPDGVTGVENVAQPVDAEEQSEHRSLLRRVHVLLQRIDEKKAVVFVMHEALGHSLTEIAGLLDISESNAQTRLVRARKELHALVAEESDLAEQLRVWGGSR